MATSTPPGKARFVPASRRGTYLIYAPWARLPLGTVIKVAGGKRWEAFTRLGRSVGIRQTRAQAAAMLTAWIWQRMTSESRRHALAAMRREARIGA